MSSIIEQHSLFLDAISGKDSIGLDKDGHLYKKNKILEKFHLCNKHNPLLNEIIFNYAFSILNTIKFENFNEEDFLLYYNLGQRISAYLNENERELIKNFFFENRKKLISENEKDSSIASAKLTSELSLDSFISKKDRFHYRVEITSSGLSGSYFVKDLSGRILGVFKPMLEECFMPQNPIEACCRDYFPNRPIFYSGCVQGTGWKREIAAWKLQCKTFKIIPFTRKLKLPLVQNKKDKAVVFKKGSFQKFVRGIPLTEFRKDELNKIPRKDLFKIAAIDLLFGNGDRNPENILWNQNNKKLYPIDHDSVFLQGLDWKKSNIKSFAKFSWTTLPLTSEPIDPKTKKRILDYDLKKSCDILHKMGFSKGSIREHKVRVYFIKEGIKNNICLSTLGKMTQKNKKNKEVVIESLITKTLKDNDNKSNFYRNFKKIIKDFF